MGVKMMDLRGLKCPQPTLRMTVDVHSAKIMSGDILEAIADCPSFENDLKIWCKRMGKTLLWLKDEDNGIKRCQIQI